MKFNIAAAVGACILWTGAAIAQSPDFSSAQRLEGDVLVAKSARGFADSLKDPESAKFRDVFLRKTIGRDGKEHVGLCGQVNAKNGYGGMSGWHYFMLIGDKVWVGGSDEIINADELCNNGRGIVDTRDYTPELRDAFDKQQGG